MSKVIDEKVVEMRFDNQNFEKNVQSSLNTLDKLKSKLNLTGASKGLENINAAANKVNMSGLSNALETVRVKFSALEVIGVTALSRITNTAINAGVNLVKSLSTDNIYSGWTKLQQKANSMSTLLSQGYNTDTVENQLEKLNWFSDETSYNFTDMIDNISKFTATGKGLEDSVTAMEGIALWAAKSGQNASKASMAMYQLSQALGAGYMRKEDWKSIQNYSMDTDEFRQVVLDTATAMGTLKKVGDDTYRSLTGDGKAFTKSQFAESLTRGQWFTSDVMMNVYKTYAKGADQMKNVIDTMSDDYGIDFITTDLIRAYNSLKGLDKQGRTFESFLADNGVEGEAADRLRDMISQLDEFGMKALAAGQEYRTFNDVIDSTKDAVSTKWMGIFETILGNIDSQKELWTTIGEKFYEWFAEPLNELQSKLDKWVDLGGRSDLFEALGNMAKAIGAITKPIKEAFREIFPKKTAEDLYNITKSLKDFTSKLIISEETANKIKTTFKGLFSVISIGINFVKNLGSGLWNIAKALFGFSGNILDATSKISEFLTKIKDVVFRTDIFGKVINGISNFVAKFVTNFGDWLKNFGTTFLPALWNTVKTIANAIHQAFGRIFEAVGNAIQSGDASKFVDLFNKGLLALLLNKLRGFINYLMKGGTFFDKIKKAFESVQSIADSISGVLDSVRKSLVVWQEQLKVKTLLKIATAIGILALALTVLSDIDRDKLENGLSAITVLFIELMATLKILAKGNFIDANKKMTTAIGLAISISILAGALKKISDIPFGDLIKGVIALGVLLKIMTKAINSIAVEGKKSIKGASGIIALSIAIKILASACKDLGSLDIDVLIKGLGAITVLLAELWAFTKFSKSSGQFIKLGASLILIGAALKIMVSVIESLSDLRIDQVGVALAAISGVLLAVWGFMKFSSKSKQVLITAVALNIVVMAIKKMVKPIQELGNLRIDQVGVALAAIGGSLLIVVGALAALGAIANKGGFFAGINMKFASDSVKGLVGTLEKIVQAFNELSKLNWDDVWRSIVSIVFTLGALVTALKLMNKEDPFGLILCATALNVLARSIRIVADLGWMNVIVGLGGLVGILVTLGVGTKLIKPLIPTMFKLAGALVSLSGSFILLGASIFAVGLGLTSFIAGLAFAFLGFKLIGLDTIVKGLVGIAGAFIVIGVAAKVLKPLTGAMFSLAGAMIVFGLSVASVGVGVSLIVSALSTMAAVGKEGAESAGLALKALVGSLLELIPMAVEALGKGIIEILKIVGNMVPVLGDILVKVIAMLMNVLVQSSFDIADGLFTFIVNMLTELNKYAPQIIDLLVDFIVTTLNKLSDRLPEIVPAIINFLDNLAKCVMDAFRNLETDSVLKTAEGLSLLLLTMVGVLKILKGIKFNPKDMNKSMLAFAELAGIVVVLGAVLGAMVAFTTSPEAAITAATGLSILLLAMTGVLKILSTMTNMNLGNITKSIVALAAMAIPLALFMLVLRGMSDVNGAIKNAIALSILAGAISLALIPLIIVGNLAKSNAAGLIVGIAALSAMAIPLALFMLVLRGMSDVNGAIKNVIALTTLATAMTLLLIPLTILGAIAIGTGGIGAAAIIIGIASLAGMALPLAAFVGVLQAMSGIPNAIENAYALTDMAKSLTGMLVALSLVAPLLLVADVAITGLVAIIAGVGILATAVGALMEKFPQLQEFLNKGLPVLEQIALSIGTILGNLVNGFMTAATSNLGEIGKKLSEFAINALPFIAIMSTINDSLGEGVKRIGGALLILMGANLLEVISKFLTGGQSFSRLGIELSNFAVSALPFIAIMAKVDPSTMEGAHNLADAILALTTGNLVNAITGWITGKADMSEFANSLGPLGAGIKTFIDNVGDFGEDKIPTIKTACEAIKILAEVSDELPKIGGLAQAFKGKVDFTNFIESMPGLGSGIVSFVTNLGTFKDEQIKTVKAGCEAIKTLAEVANDLPKMNGIAQAFSGTTDLKSFADSLKDVATGVRDFVTELTKDEVINDNSIKSVYVVTDILKSISEIKDIDVDKKGKQLEKMASSLTEMAKKLKEMTKGFTEISEDDIKASIAIVDMIIQLANKVSEFNTDSIKNFGENLKNLGTDAIKKFIAALNEEQPKKDAAEAINKIIDSLIDAGNKKQDDLTKSFTAISEAATEALYSDSIKAKIAQSGANFVAGFANAIVDRDGRVYNAAYTLGRRAVTAVNKATDEHSPSKETYKTGKFFVLGFVNGIKTLSDKVYNESYSLGNDAKMGLTKAISRISDIIDSDIDSQPTIRPVLDLSDIENGVGTLSSMFGTPTVGVMSNLNAISSGMNERGQNGGEVVNAINRLRKDLGNVSNGDTYNINGITYDNGSELQEAVSTLVRAARIERRV